jgi:uncharacterized membrane protein
MVPANVAPFVGEVMATVGGVEALTVRVAAMLVTLPAVLLTNTVNCDPLSALVVARVV